MKKWDKVGQLRAFDAARTRATMLAAAQSTPGAAEFAHRTLSLSQQIRPFRHFVQREEELRAAHHLGVGTPASDGFAQVGQRGIVVMERSHHGSGVEVGPAGGTRVGENPVMPVDGSGAVAATRGMQGVLGGVAGSARHQWSV
jgi:hypothetical protein